MILAIRDKKAYYYNTLEEKLELLEHYKFSEYKVFTNDDVLSAKIYSDVEKVKGFCTNEFNNYDILQELCLENISVAKFIDNENFYKFVILNDIYYLNTREYLEYDHSKDTFVKAIYTSYYHNLIKNMCNKIYYFSHCNSLSIKEATHMYFKEYYLNFGYFPWSIIKKSSIATDEDELYFERLADDIIIARDDIKQKVELRKVSNRVFYNINEINTIKEENIFINFKDEEILKVIKEIH